MTHDDFNKKKFVIAINASLSMINKMAFDRNN